MNALVNATMYRIDLKCSEIYVVIKDDVQYAALL